MQEEVEENERMHGLVKINIGWGTAEQEGKNDNQEEGGPGKKK